MTNRNSGLRAATLIVALMLAGLAASPGRAADEPDLIFKRSTVVAQANLIGRIEMGSTADKIAGLTNEAVGKVEQGAGKAVGSDKLQVEGAAQEAKGAAQKAIGEAKAATKDAANKAADFLNRKF